MKAQKQLQSCENAAFETYKSRSTRLAQSMWDRHKALSLISGKLTLRQITR